MEEEVNYAAVTFRTNGFSPHEKPNDLGVIYDEVNAVEQARDSNSVIPEKKKKTPLYYLPHLMAACLGILCIILVSVFIALMVQCKSGQLVAENLQLRAEKADLEKLTEELTRERDGLNWTINNCPQRVSKPCPDDWMLFQSKCYLFEESPYSSKWRTWKQSQEKCRETKADLVVIESQEEQKFINNHTEYYNDENHGYWIGLKKISNTWRWWDGSNVTVKYWKGESPVGKGSCALILQHVAPLANWKTASCTMKNRWICETKAFIKE